MNPPSPNTTSDDVSTLDGTCEINVCQFLSLLDALEMPAPLSQLQGLLGRLVLSDSDLQPYLKFSDETYQRNLVARNEKFEVLLLCFEAGQRTPIHDHAGSACGVRVVKGAGVETVFEPTEDGWLFATGSSQLPAGGVVGSVDMDIHQLSNLQADGKRLVTLHIYSPPLGEVGNYCITDNSITKVTAASRR